MRICLTLYEYGKDIIKRRRDYTRHSHKGCRGKPHCKESFPVVVDSAQLPYVAYRRSRLERNPTKAKAPGADTVQIDVNCYAATYEESIALAEAVRAALDYAQGEIPGLKMRSCTLADAEEFYEDDAFVESLAFKVQI